MNERFYLISLLSTYVYLKEHCRKIENCSSEKRNDNIDKILELLQPLENYVHIPDKIDFLNQAYDAIELIWSNNKVGHETELFKKVKIDALNLKKYEKREILNILIYIVNEDDKVSILEKEFLLQLASTFGFNEDYKQLLTAYDNSPFKKPFPIKKMSAIVGVLIVILLAGIYFISQKIESGDIHIFKEQKIMFNKLSFNRFIIYKNKYRVENTHFAKQAVFNIWGTAQVGFNPHNIVYDIESKTVTYYLPKDAPFIVEVTSKVILIDEANPVPLLESEAEKMSIGLALAGGLAGAKAGKSLASIYPNPLVKMGATLSGGAVGSVVTGIVSFNALNGLQVSKSFSKKEKILVTTKSKELVKTILTYSDELTSMYEQNFRKYIKTQYAAKGLSVKKIIFSTDKLDGKVRQ
jgi:hypothetical protein